MDAHNGNPPAADELRRRAEDRLAAQAKPTAPLTPAEAEALVHELQVHQIELEMQNDELRRIQHQLEVSRDRYTDLFDYAPVGYFTLDANGVIVEANQTGAQLLGRERTDLPQQPWTRFITPEDQDTHYLHNRRLFQTGEPQSYEIRIVEPDGNQRWVLVEAMTARNPADHEPVCRISINDISAQKQAEQELYESSRRLEAALNKLEKYEAIRIQQERLAAVGQLAAGIAHDINNTLTVILGYAEQMKLAPDIPQKTQERLQKIVNASNRIALLVQQLLDFSRKSLRLPKQLDLATRLSQSIAVLRDILPENIQIDLKLDTEESVIQVDPAQMEQLLTNLVDNARDAMPDGGILGIGLARIEKQAGEICPTCGEDMAGTWIRLTVSDTGSGIPASVQPYIFEPFFTTKPFGQGSGLGLAQVYGIIRQYGNHIQVESSSENGTTFAVDWCPGEHGSDRICVPDDIRRGNGQTILLVEDKSEVLQVYQETLESFGYCVLAAVRGLPALTLYENHMQEIALVLSDLVMPDMSGTALYERMKIYNAQVKLIIMSGYPLADGGKSLLARGVISWFQKPIPPAELSAIIAEALV